MKKHAGKALVGLLAVIAIASVYVFNFVELPYVIYTPGAAEAVGPMISVENGEEDDEGVFMLTTVGVYSEVNVATYLYQKFNRYAEYFDKEDIYREGENRNEYDARQDYNMLSSQSSAVLAVYESLDIPYELRTQEIRVLQIVEGVPASEVLVAGDSLVALDGRTFGDMEELLGIITSYRPGDEIELTFKRKGKEMTENIRLTDLADAGEEPRAGLGVRLASVLSVNPDNPDHRVTVEAGDIGGPSAGLMFALEIYDRLTPGDLPGGRRIAGTGEINGRGEVGAIGGVKHKVVAADREGAEVFFSPIANSEEAKTMAAKVDPSLEVVPVATLSDALDYLRKSAESGK